MPGHSIVPTSSYTALRNNLQDQPKLDAPASERSAPRDDLAQAITSAMYKFREVSISLDSYRLTESSVSMTREERRNGDAQSRNARD